MADLLESCFSNDSDGETGFFSSSERHWITKILKLKKQFPKQVSIIKLPENNNGIIYCEIPKNWFRLNPGKTLTREQREAQGENLKKSLSK